MLTPGDEAGLRKLGVNEASDPDRFSRADESATFAPRGVRTALSGLVTVLPGFGAVPAGLESLTHAN